MDNILIAYCNDNAELADLLGRELSSNGIAYDRLTNQPGTEAGSFARKLGQWSGPTLLIITDNFLKSEACMDAIQATVRSMVGRRLLITVADGKVLKNDVWENVPTQFDRVVNAIQYMNYWQTAYLDLSARESEAPVGEREAIGIHMNRVRDISIEIGEFISTLREVGYVAWAQLQKNDFELFFKTYGLERRIPEPVVISEPAPEPAPEPVPAPRAAEPAPAAEPPVVAAPHVNGLLVLTPAPHGELIDIEEEEAETPEIAAASEPATAPEPEHTEVPVLSDTDAEQTVRDAWFWFERGHKDRGMQFLETALEQYPDNDILRKAMQQAQAQFAPPPPAPEAPAETDNGLQEARSYDLMGNMASEKGDFAFAKYCWERAASLHPELEGIYRKLAYLYDAHFPESRQSTADYFTLALQQEPDDAEMRYKLAVIQIEHLDQTSEALQQLRQVVSLFPGHPQAWLQMANACLKLNDAQQAEIYYRKATGINPELKTTENDRTYLQQQPEFQPEPAVAAVAAEPEAPATETIITETPAPEKPAPKENILTVLITGATSGIGRATAEIFARAGHRLILTGRRSERLDQLKVQFEDAYQSDVLTLCFDVRHYPSVEQALGQLPEAWQEVDVLINNAGLAKGLSPIHEGSLDHWETMIDTNIKGLLYVTRVVSPGMVKRRKGHIINISSSAGKETYANGNVYCATKFAVEALTRSIRLDLHSYNIRVSQVSPGHVEETEFAINRFDGDAERAKIYNDFQPLRAADVADAIYYMVTRPPHVNVQDIYMFGTQQASATVVDRSGR